MSSGTVGKSSRPFHRGSFRSTRTLEDEQLDEQEENDFIVEYPVGVDYVEEPNDVRKKDVSSINCNDLPLEVLCQMLLLQFCGCNSCH